jgi:hypothetical protein
MAEKGKSRLFRFSKWYQQRQRISRELRAFRNAGPFPPQFLLS